MRLSWPLFVCVVSCSSILRASTIPVPIFSTFGPGPAGTGQVLTVYGTYVSGTGLSINAEDAIPFVVPSTGVPGFDYALSDVVIAASTSDPSANPATVSLYDASGIGGLPGNDLASLQTDLGSSPSPTPLTFTTNPNPVVISGDEYWIVLSDATSFDVTWNSGGAGAEGIAYFSSSPSPGWVYSDSYTQGAVEVDATLVAATPEPGTLLTFGGGLAAMVLCIRRRLQK